MRRPARESRLVGLLGAMALLASCGGGGGPTESRTDLGFLFEHNSSANDGRTVRWPGLPIVVFANGLADAGEITSWTGPTGVTFQFVSGRPANGISIEVRGDMSPDTCAFTLTRYTSGGTIIQAEVRVNGAIYRSAICQRTVTHEIGHAIGFFGHSTDGGLMDENGGDGRFTRRVIDMMRALYALPPGSVVAPAERTVVAGPPSRRERTVTTVSRVRR